MSEFRVQRDTIRRALHLLQEEGIVVKSTTGSRFVASARPQPIITDDVLALIVRRGKIWTAPGEILQGFSAALEQTSFTHAWFDDHHPLLQSCEELKLESSVKAARLGGAAYWPEWPYNARLLRAFKDMRPLVLLDRHVPGVETHFVGQDDSQGAKLLAQHLIQLGHSRIGFFSTDPYVEGIGERIRGYLEALAEAGIAPNPEWVLQCDNSLGLPSGILERYLTITSGSFTALICSDDILACQTIALLRERGRRVPEDIAVAGFGGIVNALNDAVGLTTTGASFQELGKIAAEILVDSASGVSRGYCEVSLPMTLNVRTSCGSSSKVISAAPSIWQH